MATRPKKRGVYDVNYVVTPKGVVAMAIPAKKAVALLFDLNLRGVPAAVVRALYAPADERGYYFLLEHVMEFNPIGVHHPALIPVLMRHQPARNYTPGGTYQFEAVGPARLKKPAPETKPRRKSPARKPARSADRFAPGKSTVGDVLGDIRKRPVGKPCNDRFVLGLQTFITEHALSHVPPRELDVAIKRFIRCDWGDVDLRQTRENNARTHDRRGPIRGEYKSRNGTAFWIVANHLEGSLVVLLPQDY